MGKRTRVGSPLGQVLATVLAIAVASGASASPGPGPAAEGPLHVPSPDWRDQVIYFLMTDRFEDGDPGNNDQGVGEYVPGDGGRYNGGDLRGVARRLDYIQGLGATTVWITPPVANQWWDPKIRYGGYHGYWAEDFSSVDAHLGDLDDYRALSRALHGRGMYLVQDIVLNHTGNWFGYDGAWDPKDPARNFRRGADIRGHQAPSQWPFSLNDARDPAQRDAAIYHWTPVITDYRVPEQVLDYQLADLDDLNTGNPVVRRALRRSYGHWIREVGVDGFRIDTIFYVPPSAVDDFLHADDAQAPGVERVAAATGRRHFLSVGEGFAVDKPFQESEARRIEAYATRPTGQGVPGMINFPLYGSLGDVFARGRPTAELGWRIESMMRVHARPHLNPSFVDNHDVDRFLAGGDVLGLQQALLAILTLPGIPTIYYGTEQEFTRPRAAMFAAGSESGGRDRFDVEAPMYRFLQQAIALRRGNRVFSRGTPAVLRGNAAGPGGIAWSMRHEGGFALVAMNTAGHEVLLDNLDTGLPPGTRLAGAFAIGDAAPQAQVDGSGRLHLRLPPRSARVWLARDAAGPVRDAGEAPTLASFPTATVQDDVTVGGLASGRQVALVVDGDLGGATVVDVESDGRWSARLSTAAMVDPDAVHRVVAWDPQRGVASAARELRVHRRWTTLARVADPADDDRGPEGRYRYPTDESWTPRTLDLRELRVEGTGGALRVCARMAALSKTWNPPNGFDPVAFTLFIQWPDETGGASAMPLQNAALPDGMRWHLRLRAHGWSNALFGAEGADATYEGRTITPAATLTVDEASQSVCFMLPPSVLGHRRSLSGARLYLSTWDYDGGFRALEPAVSGGRFGGGDGARDPLVMDDSAVVVLP